MTKCCSLFVSGFLFRVAWASRWRVQSTRGGLCRGEACLVRERQSSCDGRLKRRPYIERSSFGHASVAQRRRCYATVKHLICFFGRVR
ncbi:MAG TPA: hypothetical protein VGB55_00270, partial [Tepidisphaeraceae bacterium]